MKFYDISYSDPEKFEKHQYQFYAIQSEDGTGVFIEVREHMEPEDVLFGRDLSFVWEIPSLIYFIHAHGDETLQVVSEEFEEFDDYQEKVYLIKDSIVVNNNDHKTETV